MSTRPQQQTQRPAAEQVNETLLDSITVSEGGVSLQNMSEVKEFARMAFKSGLCPKGIDSIEKAAIAIQMGGELGLKPMQSIQNIAVINGRPTLWGDALIGVVLGSPLCDDIDERVEGTGDGAVAICRAKRRGSPEYNERRFDVADAKKAGLWGKAGPWQQYPKRMLQMRARGFCLRDTFPDILKGIITAEEAIDLNEIEVAERPPIREPRRASEAVPNTPAQTAPSPAAAGDSEPLESQPAAAFEPGPDPEAPGDLASLQWIQRSPVGDTGRGIAKVKQLSPKQGQRGPMCGVLLEGDGTEMWSTYWAAAPEWLNVGTEVEFDYETRDYKGEIKLTISNLGQVQR